METGMNKRAKIAMERATKNGRVVRSASRQFLGDIKDEPDEAVFDEEEDDMRVIMAGEEA